MGMLKLRVQPISTLRSPNNHRKGDTTMKELYTAPEANVINLAAVEKLAVLEGHPDAGISTVGNDDFFSVNQGAGSGRPGV